MVKKVLIKASLATLLSISFVGCVANTSIKVKDYKSYKLKSNVNKQEIAKKLKEANKPRRVALITTNPAKQSRLAKKAGLDSIVQSQIKKHLMETGNINFITNIDSNPKLKEKIIDLEYDGINIEDDIFDYIILTKIENAGFTNKFQEAYRTECTKIINNQKVKTTCVVPPRMTYTATVSGAIEVLHLIDNKLVNELELPFSDNASRTEDTRREKKLETDNTLMAKATKDAIRQSRIKIMNYFAPKGFIQRGKRKEKDYIFQTTLGLGKIKEGDKVVIYHEQKEINPLTGKLETTIKEVANGVVSSESTNKYSWIIIDGDNGENVELGDFIQVKYESTLMDSVLKVGTFLNSLGK